jgi:hypothetical protein
MAGTTLTLRNRYFKGSLDKAGADKTQAEADRIKSETKTAEKTGEAAKIEAEGRKALLEAQAQATLIRAEGDRAISDATAQLLREETTRRRIENEQIEWLAKLDRSSLIGYIISGIRSSSPQGHELPAELTDEQMERVRGLIDTQMIPSVEKLLRETLPALLVSSTDATQPDFGSSSVGNDGDK